MFEAQFNYDIHDKNATILEDERIIKIRKLNKKIGDNLKLLYAYRCQICGQYIGSEYGARVVEAHHIDYFVTSINNDANNQLIVCPNHHSIIHEVSPVFNKKELAYIGNIRTPIPETSGQRNGHIRTAFRPHPDTLSS